MGTWGAGEGVRRRGISRVDSTADGGDESGRQAGSGRAADEHARTTSAGDPTRRPQQRAPHHDLFLGSNSSRAHGHIRYSKLIRLAKTLTLHSTLQVRRVRHRPVAVHSLVSTSTLGPRSTHYPLSDRL